MPVCVNADVRILKPSKRDKTLLSVCACKRYGKEKKRYGRLLPVYSHNSDRLKSGALSTRQEALKRSETKRIRVRKVAEFMEFELLLAILELRARAGFHRPFVV